MTVIMITRVPQGYKRTHSSSESIFVSGCTNGSRCHNTLEAGTEVIWVRVARPYTVGGVGRQTQAWAWSTRFLGGCKLLVTFETRRVWEHQLPANNQQLNIAHHQNKVSQKFKLQSRCLVRWTMTPGFTSEPMRQVTTVLTDIVPWLARERYGHRFWFNATHT